MAPALILEEGIRNWVLLPITLSMLLVGLIRAYTAKLMKREPKINRDKIAHAQTLIRTSWLKTNCNFIPAQSFAARRHYFTAEETGQLSQKMEAVNPSMAMLEDPGAATEMFTRYAQMMIPQILMFSFVSYFFSGFVIAKIPFPLTQSFRIMLQRGIDLTDLDVSYVSSVSWYFVNFAGLRGILSIMTDNTDAIDDFKNMQMGMGMGGPVGPDMGQLFKKEKEQIEILQHRNDIDFISSRATLILEKLAKE